MEGIILFADDELNSLPFMKGIYEGLVSQSKFPVLGVDNLDLAKKSILSINNFKALILDFTFKEKSDDPDFPDTERKISEVLEDENLHIFSLIYIYSQEDVEQTEFGTNLKKKYGESSIRFRIKSSGSEDVLVEYQNIIQDIEKWDEEHKHLSVAKVWNKSLGQAIQRIFNALDKADPFWVKDLFYSSYTFDKNNNPKEPPPVDPNIQVINLFQNILSEHLIQDTELRNIIEEYSKDNLKNETNSTNLKNLYQYLYYTNTLSTDAIMTGDVFKLDENRYGIIISPECDMNTLIVKNMNVEVLCFEKDDFENKFYNTFQIKKEDQTAVGRAFNQENPRGHLFPAFPFSKEEIKPAFLDFRFALELFKGGQLNDLKENRLFKINSPYIQQLRQRYLAYIGRVGVPAIPHSLRLFNLK